MGMLNMNDIFGKGLKNKKKTKLKIGEAYEPLIQEEIEKIAEKQNVVQNAIKSVQESGIVFIDEIDKIAPNSEKRGGDVSREGVQRDFLAFWRRQLRFVHRAALGEAALVVAGNGTIEVFIRDTRHAYSIFSLGDAGKPRPRPGAVRAAGHIFARRGFGPRG